jgi:hypothetical protein
MIKVYQTIINRYLELSLRKAKRFLSVEFSKTFSTDLQIRQSLKT